jgi:hypothetical protein
MSVRMKIAASSAAMIRVLPAVALVASVGGCSARRATTHGAYGQGVGTATGS